MRAIIKPGLILFIVTLVASALLGAVNVVTADIIIERELAAKRESMAQVMPLAYENNFSPDIATENDGVTAYNIAYGIDGDVCGYVFSVGIKGYGGKFEILVGIDTQGVVTGVAMGTNSETPGLGKNAEKDAFRKQFNGKSGALTVVKGGGAGESEIDAVTAATITSRAVTSGVNQAMEYYSKVAE